MKLISMRKLGLAGGLAIAGLLLAPLAATADVNKCSKELTKNAAKVATDVQKELAKCVDGWLKDEDAVLANAGKGKYSFDGVTGNASKLGKAAAKCQKSLLKIQTWGSDVGVPGDQEKTKLGKAYNKLLAAVTAGKPKCGVVDKVFDTSVGGALDDEMVQLGWFPPSADTTALGGTGMAGIDVRLMIMGGVATAWDTQGALNRDSYRTFQAMGNDRCAVSGIPCDDISDCDPNDALDVCSPSQCPDCIKFARAVDVTTGSPVCSDSSPCDGTLGTGPGTCFGLACVGESDCAAPSGATTDYCDTAPSQGAMAGPCYMASCQAGDPATSASTSELEGVLDLALPTLQYICDDDGKCNIPAPAVSSFKNDFPAHFCDIQEVLPNAVALVGGSARGESGVFTVELAPGFPVDVASLCLDSAGWAGYVDKGTALPQFDLAACADVDYGTDWGSGAGADDGCSASLRCSDTVVDDPDNPGTPLHTGKSCIDLQPATPAAGHALLTDRSILTTGTLFPVPGGNPCDPATRIAAGEPSTGGTWTTHSATGNLWDAGPINTGLPQPIYLPGNFAFNNGVSGVPFDPSDLAAGELNGAFVVSYGGIATETATTLGASLNQVLLDCQP